MDRQVDFVHRQAHPICVPTIADLLQLVSQRVNEFAGALDIGAIFIDAHRLAMERPADRSHRASVPSALHPTNERHPASCIHTVSYSQARSKQKYVRLDRYSSVHSADNESARFFVVCHSSVIWYSVILFPWLPCVNPNHTLGHRFKPLSELHLRTGSGVPVDQSYNGSGSRNTEFVDRTEGATSTNLKPSRLMIMIMIKRHCTRTIIDAQCNHEANCTRSNRVVR